MTLWQKLIQRIVVNDYSFGLRCHFVVHGKGSQKSIFFSKLSFKRKSMRALWLNDFASGPDYMIEHHCPTHVHNVIRYDMHRFCFVAHCAHTHTMYTINVLFFIKILSAIIFGCIFCAAFSFCQRNYYYFFFFSKYAQTLILFKTILNW